ncbi:hypothetical protein BLS_006591 [Venturia inaequalis]|uniref:Uncharacterized protein n=1 Tax=Venturia inaequalis TaxID=5025 RepID=A0A8H3V7Y9_VENIN|nr:hypothetical protein BLS_006591 [Venturia inaequalis]
MDRRRSKEFCQVLRERNEAEVLAKLENHPPPGPIRHGMSLRARKHMASPYARPSECRTVRKPKQPKSHYKALSAEQKQTIRPFVFIELPAELRLKVYGLILLVPAFDVERNDARSIMHDRRSRYIDRTVSNRTQGRLILKWPPLGLDPDHPQYHHQLQIMQCCRQLCKEGRDYFWNQNRIEQHNDFFGYMAPHLNSPWPKFGMHLPSIRTLRVRFAFPNRVASTFNFRCNCLKNLPNLETLQIACVFIRNGDLASWAVDGESRRWREVLVLGAVVRQIILHTPSKVLLRWGLWEDALGDKAIKTGAFISVHRNILENLAKSYKHERGRNVQPAIKEKGGD